MVELLRLALPMVVSQGAFAVMIFADRYFTSQIDPAHMAAALGGGVASFFSFCFFIGLFSYSNALAAQYLGVREVEKCPKVVTLGRTHVVMICDVFGLVINVPLCYVMVLGKPGFPAWEIVGAGVSGIFGMSLALHGELTTKNGAVVEGNFDTYPMTRMSEAPAISIA